MAEMDIGAFRLFMGEPLRERVALACLENGINLHEGQDLIKFRIEECQRDDLGPLFRIKFLWTF